jgi:hypothetical protein
MTELLYDATHKILSNKKGQTNEQAAFFTKLHTLTGKQESEDRNESKCTFSRLSFISTYTTLHLNSLIDTTQQLTLAIYYCLLRKGLCQCHF